MLIPLLCNDSAFKILVLALRSTVQGCKSAYHEDRLVLASAGLRFALVWFLENPLVRWIMQAFEPRQG
jgi:hypothetical protein